MNDNHELPGARGRPEPSANANREAAARVDRPKPRKSTHASTNQTGQGSPKLLTITVDAETARVVSIQGVDATGIHHELSTTDREVLLHRGTDGRVEDVVEQAFEAGIACVLDDEPAPLADGESAEEAELRHQLLAPLIKRSGAEHLTERTVLDRAILSTLIDRAAK